MIIVLFYFQIWFQNKRARWRRRVNSNRNNPYNYASPSVTAVPAIIPPPYGMMQHTSNMIQQTSQMMQPQTNMLQQTPYMMQSSPNMMQQTPYMMQSSPTTMQQTPYMMQQTPNMMHPSQHQVQQTPNMLQQTSSMMQRSQSMMQQTPMSAQMIPEMLHTPQLTANMSPPMMQSTSHMYKQLLPTSSSPQETQGLTKNKDIFRPYIDTTVQSKGYSRQSDWYPSATMAQPLTVDIPSYGNGIPFASLAQMPTFH